MRGTQNQAIGRSRGGLTTKIGALVDALGNLIAFVLVPGQRHDVNLVDKLMHGVACGAFLDDKAFDANKVREFLARNCAVAVIPPRKGTKGADSYDREKYKWCHLIENFCRIKAFRHIATRYEKTDTRFATSPMLSRPCG
jgi:transposase